MKDNDSMDQEMIKKIDSVLETVLEPESGLSVKDLGLVGRVTYSENYNRLVIKTSFSPTRRNCMLCGIITAAVQRTIMRELEEQFIIHFPDVTITVE